MNISIHKVIINAKFDTFSLVFTHYSKKKDRKSRNIFKMNVYLYLVLCGLGHEGGKSPIFVVKLIN